MSTAFETADMTFVSKIMVNYLQSVYMSYKANVLKYKWFILSTLMD